MQRSYQSDIGANKQRFKHTYHNGASSTREANPLGHQAQKDSKFAQDLNPPAGTLPDGDGHAVGRESLTSSSLCGEDDGPALPRVKKQRLGFKKGYKTTAKNAPLTSLALAADETVEDSSIEITVGDVWDAMVWNVAHAIGALPAAALLDLTSIDCLAKQLHDHKTAPRYLNLRKATGVVDAMDHNTLYRRFESSLLPTRAVSMAATSGAPEWIALAKIKSEHGCYQKVRGLLRETWKWLATCNLLLHRSYNGTRQVCPVTLVARLQERLDFRKDFFAKARAENRQPLNVLELDEHLFPMVVKLHRAAKVGWQRTFGYTLIMEESQIDWNELFSLVKEETGHSSRNDDYHMWSVKQCKTRGIRGLRLCLAVDPNQATA